MNNTENISILDDHIANKPSNLDFNIAAVLLGMNIVNETKQHLKNPLHKENLTMNQWLVLQILFLERANSPSEVANIMNTDAAAVTRNVDRLEHHGLIERTRQARDRRVIHIDLTPKGMRVAKKIFASYAGLLSNFENRLTQNELVIWRKFERSIASHLSEIQVSAFGQ